MPIVINFSAAFYSLSTSDIAFYLNSSATRALLHTDAQPPSFESISWPVNHAFINGGDMLRDSAPHIGQLLDRGVRTPVYAGAYDLICSWFGTEATTRALEWHGQTQFEKQEMGEWKVEGVKAGLTRSWGDLTFASVYAAGHMVRMLWYRAA